MSAMVFKEKYDRAYEKLRQAESAAKAYLSTAGRKYDREQYKELLRGVTTAGMS